VSKIEEPKQVNKKRIRKRNGYSHEQRLQARKRLRQRDGLHTLRFHEEEEGVEEATKIKTCAEAGLNAAFD